MKRVCFLRLLGVVCVSAGSALVSSGGERRPNFLFVYTDDQRYDALSVVQAEQGQAARFPWFKTPNMDRLAAEGVRFRNAFVVNSLCAPSRAVNLTGRYSHFNGVASNFRPFPTNNVTHATLLRAAGYTTAYIGKWHMDSQRERPGFDYHASYVGHARYPDADFIVDGVDTPSKGWIDDVSTDYAIGFMRRQKGSSKPWSMVVGFKAPHGPFQPPARAKGRFTGELARSVPNLTSPAPYMGEAGKKRAAEASSRSDAGNVPAHLDYFRCISAADDCLGRLLDALDETGFASNTVVIYTSDNGFYLGEHGLGDKRSAYDESLRVPFIVRDPACGLQGRGKVVDEMVLNLDLAQTLLDYAGVPAPQAMQGQSWRPLLSGKTEGWRSSWLYEYFAENQKNSRVPDITALRTAEAKLIVYHGHPDWSELFDLKADPYETKNLFSEHAAEPLRTRMAAEHLRLLQEAGYCVPSYTDRPKWWGKPGGADWKPDGGVDLLLRFDGKSLNGARVTDQSGRENHGVAKNVTAAQGRGDKPALHFSGEASIEIAKSASLNLSENAWTVLATLEAEKPDGMILARGGKSLGYALWLKGGRPAWTVNVGDKPVTVMAKQPVTGWVTLAGVLSADRKAQLYVNGKQVASMGAPGFMEKDPNEAMQVGVDMGSPVIEPVPPKFVGRIESVSVFRGEAADRGEVRP
jgi:arylsulfatase A-like enzyme